MGVTLRHYLLICYRCVNCVNKQCDVARNTCSMLYDINTTVSWKIWRNVPMHLKAQSTINVLVLVQVFNKKIFWTMGVILCHCNKALHEARSYCLIKSELHILTNLCWSCSVISIFLNILFYYQIWHFMEVKWVVNVVSQLIYCLIDVFSLD